LDVAASKLLHHFETWLVDCTIASWKGLSRSIGHIRVQLDAIGVLILESGADHPGVSPSPEEAKRMQPHFFLKAGDALATTSQSTEHKVRPELTKFQSDC